MPVGFLMIFCIQELLEDFCCLNCVSVGPIFTKANLCSTQPLLFMKTAWRQSFVNFRKRRGHFKLTTVVNVSSPAHIRNVTFLQRTPVVSIFRLRKWRPWVYLREIMESYSDRRFMFFEWYHLQQLLQLWNESRASFIWPHLHPSQQFGSGTRTQLLDCRQYHTALLFYFCFILL